MGVKSDWLFGFRGLVYMSWEACCWRGELTLRVMVWALLPLCIYELVHVAFRDCVGGG